MKNENHESTLAYFHDQKNGGFNPETGEIYHAHKNKNYQKFIEEDRINKEIGDTDELKQHIISIIQIVNNLSLMDEYKDEPRQKILLAEKKKTMKNLILDVFRHTEEYIVSMRNLDETKLHKDEMIEKNGQEFFAKELANLDFNRTAKHEVLMDSINIANRFAYQNFFDYDQETLERWQEKEEEKNREVAYVQRIKLPENIILPDKIKMTNRKNITDWAIQISEGLSKMRKQLQ